jgi:hypothetical protein
MKRLIGAFVFLVSIASCAAPPAPRNEILDRKELHLNGAKGLSLSIREPVDEETIQRVVDANKRGYFLVRVFTYGALAEVGKDNPARRFDWTSVDGLKKSGDYR